MPRNGFLGQLYYSITGEDKLEEILRKDKKLAQEVAKIAGGIKIGKTRITDDYAKTILAEQKAAEAQAKAEAIRNESMAKTAILEQRLQTEIEKTNAARIRAESAARRLSKTEETAAGSIKMLEAELKKLKDTYRSLSEAGRNSPLGQAMLKEINNADENLAKINAQMANNANLAKTMGTQYNGLRTQIGMVARELPNLGISLSTFIISLSNNLPYLADEIAKARKEYDNMIKTNQKATPVWKQMIGAVFNWQTALIVGVTVLVAYSREIQAWVQGLIDGNGAVSELTKTQKTLNDLHDNAAKSAAKETAQLHLLYGVTQDTTRTIQERTAAAEQLQKLFPDYFGNLSTEIIMIGGAKTVYEALAKSIEDVARARILQERYAEIEESMIEKQKERLNLTEKINTLQKILSESEGQDTSMRQKQLNAYDKLNKRLRNVNIEIEALNKSYKMLQDSYSPIDTTPPIIEQPLTQSKYYDDYVETLNKLRNSLELAEINQEEFNKKENEAIGVMINAAKAAGISDVSLQRYTNRYKEFNKEQQNLKLQKVENKEAEEIYKRQQDYLKATKALENAVLQSERNIEQTRINLMEEGGEKQLAQLKLNFQKRMDEVKKQTDEYVKMVQDQELKAWKEKNPTKKESEFVPQTVDFNTLPKNLQDIIVKQAQGANKEYEKNTQNLINNLLKKWGDYGDKRAALEAETADKIKQVNSVRNLIGDDAADRAIETLKRQLQEGINALESESLKLTPFYQQLFGDIANYGNAMLRSLTEQTRNILAEAQKGGKNSKGTYSVEVEGQQIELTEGDIARLQKRLGEMDRQMSSNNPFTKLKNAIRDYKYASSDAAKDQAFKEQLESISAIAGGLSQSLSGLQDTLNVVGVNSPELDAVFGGLEKTLGGLASIDINNPFTVITGGLQAIGGLFQTIFNPRQARLQKIIENSQREVKRLQNAFDDLDRAIDKALGDEVYSVSKEQIGNLRQQQAELSKQIQAERDKKKTDEDFIADASRQIEELNQQIIEIVDNIRENILGGTVQEIAGQLGDAFFDAFGKGEDAAEAWGKKVDEIVQGVIRRMLIQKLIEKPVGQILEKYTSKWIDDQGNFMGYDEIMQSATNLGDELKDFGDGLSSIIDKLPDNIKQYLQLEESLSQSIKGITEDQAGIGISYLNAIRADQSVTRNNLQRLTDTAIPFFNDFAIHVANLKHLETIANNTGRNADIAGRIEELLNAVTRPGSGRKLNI